MSIKRKHSSDDATGRNTNRLLFCDEELTDDHVSIIMLYCLGMRIECCDNSDDDFDDDCSRTEADWGQESTQEI